MNINGLMKDMSSLINAQGKDLDLVVDDAEDTNRQIVAGKKEVVEANEIAKRSMKKYIFIVLLVIIIAGGITAFVITSK